jgi:cell division protein FtsA
VVADVEELVATGFASAQSVLTETEKELGVILVDFGGGTTTIMVYIEGAPFYTSVLPIGARNVTNDIAIGLRLSLEAAEKIKIAISSKEKKPVLPTVIENKQTGKPAVVEKEGKGNEDDIDLSKLGILEETKKVSRKTLIEGIIRPRLNEVFGMVGVEIKNSGAAGLTPAGLVVSGGGAQTVGLIESAKRTLSMPVRVGVPQGITGLIDDVKTPDFAAVIGLVIYGAKKEGQLAPRFSLRSFGKNLPKFPIKGVVGKGINLIKSFLP